MQPELTLNALVALLNIASTTSGFSSEQTRKMMLHRRIE
jgi:hypothetical protein